MKNSVGYLGLIIVMLSMHIIYSDAIISNSGINDVKVEILPKQEKERPEIACQLVETPQGEQDKEESPLLGEEENERDGSSIVEVPSVVEEVRQDIQEEIAEQSDAASLDEYTENDQSCQSNTPSFEDDEKSNGKDEGNERSWDEHGVNPELPEHEGSIEESDAHAAEIVDDEDGLHGSLIEEDDQDHE